MATVASQATHHHYSFPQERLQLIMQLPKGYEAGMFLYRHVSIDHVFYLLAVLIYLDVSAYEQFMKQRLNIMECFTYQTAVFLNLKVS